MPGRGGHCPDQLRQGREPGLSPSCLTWGDGYWRVSAPIQPPQCLAPGSPPAGGTRCSWCMNERTRGCGKETQPRRHTDVGPAFQE